MGTHQSLRQRRIHLSTIWLSVLSAIALTLAVLPGERTYAKWHHGWPWTWLEHDVRYDVDVVFLIATDDVWTFNSPSNAFSAWALAGDVAVGLLLLASIFALVEWRWRRRRSCLQMTLRDLFVRTLLVAIACAWGVHHWRMHDREKRLYRQMEAKELVLPPVGVSALPHWITEKTGSGFRFDQYIAMRFRENATDEVFDDLNGFRRLYMLELVGSQITDAGKVRLPEFSHLESLGLDSVAISDNGMRHVAQLPNLVQLLVYVAQIGDASAEYISQLAHLEDLTLAKTDIGDAGVSKLVGLSRLRWLDLSHTHLSDSGLQAISQLPRLEWLNVHGTQVSDEAVARFRAAHPHCFVLHRRAP